MIRVEKKWSAVITNSDEYVKLSAEKENPEREYSGKKYRIMAIPEELCQRLSSHLEEVAEEASEEAFDSYNELENYSDEECVSDLLKLFYRVTHEPDIYEVVVTISVQAESESEAEDKVDRALAGEGFEDYSIDSTNLQ